MMGVHLSTAYQAYARIEELLLLPQGWHADEDAEPPNAVAAAAARVVVDACLAANMPILRIIASGDGGFFLLVKCEAKWMANVECFNDGTVLAETSGETVDVWSVDIANPFEIQETLRRLSAAVQGQEPHA